jgi:hypothetical protein
MEEKCVFAHLPHIVVYDLVSFEIYNEIDKNMTGRWCVYRSDAGVIEYRFMIEEDAVLFRLLF